MRLRQYVPCRECGGTLQLLGQLGRMAWYRCRHCGLDVSREFRRTRARNPSTAGIVDRPAGRHPSTEDLES